MRTPIRFSPATAPTNSNSASRRRHLRRDRRARRRHPLHRPAQRARPPKRNCSDRRAQARSLVSRRRHHHHRSQVRLRPHAGRRIETAARDRVGMRTRCAPFRLSSARTKSRTNIAAACRNTCALVIDEMLPAIARRNSPNTAMSSANQRSFSVEDSRHILTAARALRSRLTHPRRPALRSGAAALAAELCAATADHLEHTTRAASRHSKPPECSPCCSRFGLRARHPRATLPRAT